MCSRISRQRTECLQTEDESIYSRSEPRLLAVWIGHRAFGTPTPFHFIPAFVNCGANTKIKILRASTEANVEKAAP